MKTSFARNFLFVRRPWLAATAVGLSLTVSPAFSASNTGTGAATPESGTGARSGSPSGAAAAAGADTPSQSQQSSQQANPDSQDSTELAAQDRQFIEQAFEMGALELAASRLALAQAQDADVRSYAQQLVRDHQAANMRLAELSGEKGVSLAAASTSRLGSPVTGSEMPGVHGPAERAEGIDPADHNRTAPANTEGTRADAASSRPGSDPTAAGAGGNRNTYAGTADAGATRAPDSAGNQSPSEQTRSGATYGSTMGSPDQNEKHRRKLDQLAGRSGQEFDTAYVNEMVEGHRRTIELFEAQVDRGEDGELKQFAHMQLPLLRSHLDQAENLQQRLEGSTSEDDSMRDRESGANRSSAPMEGSPGAGATNQPMP